MKTLNALLLVAAAFSIELSVTADPSAEQCDSEASTGEHCTAAGRYKDPGPIEEVESLVDFKGLIGCETGESLIGVLSKYANYGCYCGKGGSGTPVDELDECCEVHDDCYGVVQEHPSCKGFFGLFTSFGKKEVPYARSYKYTCENNKAVCSESNDECRMILCECDRKAAECFANAPYNHDHHDYPQQLCEDPGPIIMETQSLVNFKSLIGCETGESLIGVLSKYADYGCYCGKGGSGTPVDELDECCEVHDDCYGVVQEHPSCKGFFGLFTSFGKKEVPYARSYKYTCENNKAVCSESNDECRMILCECDRKAAECFANAPYNHDHHDYPQHLCKDPGPIEEGVGSLNDFKNVIGCETGESLIGVLSKYANYGCYCGKGGSGTPVDELDKCCEVHDGCYGKVQEHPSCKGFFGLFTTFGKKEVPYARSYKYTCENDKAVCSESNDECRMILCECDRKAAECFADTPYNDDHWHYPQHLCK